MALVWTPNRSYLCGQRKAEPAGSHSRCRGAGVAARRRLRRTRPMRGSQTRRAGGGPCQPGVAQERVPAKHRGHRQAVLRHGITFEPLLRAAPGPCIPPRSHEILVGQGGQTGRLPLRPLADKRDPRPQIPHVLAVGAARVNAIGEQARSRLANFAFSAIRRNMAQSSRAPSG